MNDLELGNFASVRKQEDEVGIPQMENKTFLIMTLASLLTVGILCALGAGVYKLVEWLFS